MMKDQIAANSMLFAQNNQATGSSGLPLNMDANASQLALLQSFTSEMTIPTHAQLYHQPQQQPVMTNLPNVKTEINNNADEQMAGGNQ
jgi:hypothetical protein